MKKFRLFSLLLICGSLFGMEGRFFESANLSGQYLMMMSAKDGVTSVKGPGFKGSFTISLNDRLDLEIGLGYLNLDIKQDSALQQWGWSYYDSVYVKRVKNDEEAYDIIQMPKQQMTVIPLYMSVVYRYLNYRKIRAYVDCGLGIDFFKRNFWLDEIWGKNYETVVGEYYYDFRFNHYAPQKEGWVINFRFGVGSEFILTESISLDLHCIYQITPDFRVYKDYQASVYLNEVLWWVLGSEYKDHLNHYPISNNFKLSLGINFKY